MQFFNYFYSFLILSGYFSSDGWKKDQSVIVSLNSKKTYQTIEGFGASDAWSCQFLGNWPERKKNAIADWLFSTDTLNNGNPKGIGLSLWRYNLGAGSTEQGEKSGIRDEWRRAPLTTTDGPGVRAQNWFLRAARERGVAQFLAFFNSPPVQLTKNAKAFADKGKCNIDSSRMRDFALYTVQALKAIRTSTGIDFTYLSPVNEPQWDWSDGSQEGCPYDNREVSNLVRTFSELFLKNRVNTKLVIAEAGNLKYLLADEDKPARGNQIQEFFDPASVNYIGNLTNLTLRISAHSYFTTSPVNRAIALREKVRDRIAAIQGLGYWESEYCILGNNEGEIRGNKKDLGMDAALYLARVVYTDLVFADASSWQWWTAISAYDYKDGLVYVDKNKENGNYSDSKMLWALGNYSYFIRPGMKRMEAQGNDSELYVSAYRDNRQRVVAVLVNTSGNAKHLSFRLNGRNFPAGKALVTYTTDKSRNLQKEIMQAERIVVPAKSVVTAILDL